VSHSTGSDAFAVPTNLEASQGHTLPMEHASQQSSTT